MSVCLLGIWAGFSGCEDDCSNCDLYQEPDTLTVKVTLSQRSGRPVPFTLFQGSIDSRDTVYHRSIKQNSVYLLLPEEETYAGVAVYHRGQDTILAVDETEGSYQYLSGCDPACYDVDTPLLNLTLEKSP